MLTWSSFFQRCHFQRKKVPRSMTHNASVSRDDGLMLILTSRLTSTAFIVTPGGCFRTGHDRNSLRPRLAQIDGTITLRQQLDRPHDPSPTFDSLPEVKPNSLQACTMVPYQSTGRRTIAITPWPPPQPVPLPAAFRPRLPSSFQPSSLRNSWQPPRH